MICKVSSADLCGIEASLVCVEADVSGGLPAFNMVGLPSSEVKEAKDRVERAIINSGFEFPARRITINLSPASMRKQGAGFDLPIAIAILASLDVIRTDVLNKMLFIGELSLDGTINAINGVLPIAIMAKESGFEHIVVPFKNAFEGAAVEGLKIHGAISLNELVKSINKLDFTDVEHLNLDDLLNNAYLKKIDDFSDVVGQEKAKKATMVAVAGFHNVLYVGPPGAGKSMMARRIPGILNRMSKSECLEVSKIYSVAGLLENDSLVLERPFRSPHQGISDKALIGGARNPKPGEITLAHNGVLFLDELPEFKKDLIDCLRVPMEQKKITINRLARQVDFPCNFMLVAAANPCKCGFYPDRRYCKCNEIEVARYISKIKGPLLDRIDICVGVSKVRAEYFESTSHGLSTDDMRKQIALARNIQEKRFKNAGITFNSQMSKNDIDTFCKLDNDGEAALVKAYDKFNMTARGWYKILKVARTIADFDCEEKILKKHVLEAISYRNSFLNE